LLLVSALLFAAKGLVPWPALSTDTFFEVSGHRDTVPPGGGGGGGGGAVPFSSLRAGAAQAPAAPLARSATPRRSAHRGGTPSSGLGTGWRDLDRDREPGSDRAKKGEYTMAREPMYDLRALSTAGDGFSVWGMVVYHDVRIQINKHHM